jgi:hypothetical protein
MPANNAKTDVIGIQKWSTLGANRRVERLYAFAGAVGLSCGRSDQSGGRVRRRHCGFGLIVTYDQPHSVGRYAAHRERSVWQAEAN